MSERRPSEERLHRLLYVLASGACEGGTSLDGLAAELGVDARTVLQDIEEATAAAYHRPPGTVDPYEISIEAGREGDATVRVHSAGDFRRPPRLTPRETLALALGLRAMASGAPPERRRRILALARRMERELGSSIVQADKEKRRQRGRQPGGAAPVGPGAAPERAASAAPGESGDDPSGYPSADPVADADATLVEAATRQRRARIRYVKAGGVPETRTIEPWRLVHAEGLWYVLARDLGADDLRLFRTDRVLAAELLEGEPFAVPDDFDASSQMAEGVAFFGSAVEAALVRYDDPAARWVAEDAGLERGPDGSVVVEHPVADRNWIVRRILRFGGAARVLEPAELRLEVAGRAERLATERSAEA